MTPLWAGRLGMLLGALLGALLCWAFVQVVQ